MMPANSFTILSRAVKVVVGLVGLAAILSGSSAYLANRAVITGVTDEFYRYAAESPVDVLIVGNSHSQCDINTLMLSKRLGVSAYTLAGPARTLGLTRYALEDALRFTRPKLVLIDTFFIGEPEVLPGREQFAYEQLNTMKALDVRAAFIGDLFPGTDYLEASFPAISNHDGWKDSVTLHRNMLYQYGGATIDRNRYYNGFTPQYSVMEPETYRLLQTGNYKPLAPVPGRSWEYVDQMVALCRDAGAEPVFVQLPVLDAFNRGTGYDGWALTVARELEARGVAFLDFNRTEARPALGLLPQDFLNERSDMGNNHLNITGANKLTAALAAELNRRWGPLIRTGTGEPLTEPQQMIRLLDGLKEDDLVFMAVSDTADQGWLTEETERLKHLGLSHLPDGAWGESYAAVFTGGGTVLYEARSGKAIAAAFEKGQTVKGVPMPAAVLLTSAGARTGSSEARIMLDGFDYSFNYRGVNFAVFDRRSGAVRAVEQFDLYDRSQVLEGLLKP